MEIEHVYSSDESTTESEPSRLITEEDYLDMLFFSCDVFKTGKVDVSTLIEYLRFTTSSVAEVSSIREALILRPPIKKCFLFTARVALKGPTETFFHDSI